MQKIGGSIEYFVAQLAGDQEQALINLRANQVRERYKRAIETVYRDAAPLFLAHTNNVYIMDKKGARTLIVYVDESIFAAELNAQRELIKLKLLELFGEAVEEFEILVSRGGYKKNHPYLAADAGAPEPAPSVPLDEREWSYVSHSVSAIENKRLRDAFQKAMTADMEWKKGEKQNLT